jgi:hypothetical protein
MKARRHGEISLDAGKAKILEPAHAAIKMERLAAKPRISPGKDIFPVFRPKRA